MSLNDEQLKNLKMPITGMGRAKDILPYLPFGRTTLWKLVQSGEFPEPIKMGSRMTVWKYEAVREWLVKEWEQRLSNRT